MPIYYGCTNITDYFPKEAMAIIDIQDANVVEKINDIINSDQREKNLDAIAYSRQLILNKYQFFPFFAEKIRNHQKLERHKAKRYAKREIPVKSWQPLGRMGIREKTFSKVKNWLRKLRG